MKLTATILFTLSMAGTFCITSCTKTYTCHCDIKYSGTPGLPDSSVQEYTIQDSKSGAKSTCTGKSGTKTNNGITSVETCYLY